MADTPRTGFAGDPDSPWRLIADVGGTNARLALADDTGALKRQKTLRCQDYASLAAAIQHYLADQDIGSIRAAAIAVATHVHREQIIFTNRRSWSFSARELGRQLGIENCRVINDFSALALAIPRLDNKWLAPVTRDGQPDPAAPRAVIGPGTGLGVAGVIRTGTQWQALDTEGGHVTLAAADTHEAEVIQILARQFGHVSAERVLSGPGIVNLYNANCEIHGVPADTRLSPADITQKALQGSCTVCSQVLEDFTALLGTVTANLVLTLGARGGAYIGGGIVPQLQTYLGTSRFRERFEAYGRTSVYLADIPCYIVTAESPALEGTLATLDGC